MFVIDVQKVFYKQPFFLGEAKHLNFKLGSNTLRLTHPHEHYSDLGFHQNFHLVTAHRTCYF